MLHELPSNSPHWLGSSFRSTPFPLTCLSGSTCPSARTMRDAVRRGAPDLATWPLTVTLSPGLKTSLLKPDSESACGLPISAPQCTKLPASSVTSNKRPQWGLAQIHSVTVPFSVTVFSVSYATPVPWCAKSGMPASAKPKTKDKQVRDLNFI